MICPKCGYKLQQQPILNKTCRIYGSEISFEKYVPVEKVTDMCQDIWDYPEKYSDYKNESEAAYYQFLQYLWIEFPNGKDVRLSELITDNELIIWHLVGKETPFHR